MYQRDWSLNVMHVGHPTSEYSDYWSIGYLCYRLLSPHQLLHHIHSVFRTTIHTLLGLELWCYDSVYIGSSYKVGLIHIHEDSPKDLPLLLLRQGSHREETPTLMELQSLEMTKFIIRLLMWYSSLKYWIE